MTTSQMIGAFVCAGFTVWLVAIVGVGLYVVIKNRGNVHGR